MGIATMARKKTSRSKPDQREASTIAVTLRGSPEWKSWVEAAGEAWRLDVAKVIDRALIDFAIKEGFDQEAPER